MEQEPDEFGSMDDDTTTAAVGTLDGAQDASPANPRVRRHSPLHHDIGGPFAFPRRDMEDVDMHTVEEGEGDDAKEDETKNNQDEERIRRVQTMPTLPKAPMYHGCTAAEKQKFMKEYEAYCRQLAALETAFFKPFRMPVGACINDESRRLIALFDIRKPVSEITEADWVDYFWEGRIEGDLDFDKVKALLSSKLKMDIKQPDADSRVSKLLHQLYQLLEKENMEWMIDSEPKKVVRYIMDALAPETFQLVVKKEMMRESNKHLLKDVVAFTVWLRSSCKEFIRWEVAPGPVTKRTGTSGGGAPNGGSSSAGGAGKAGKGGNPASKDKNVAGAPPSTTPKPPNAAATRSCLKCDSTEHRVKDCPNIAPGEADELIKAWREKKKHSSASAIHALGGDKESQTCTTSVVEGVVTVDDTLLDSGAETTVVTRGLIRELLKKKVPLHMSKGTLHILRPFGSKAIKVWWQVVFDRIELSTAAGPLMLRHLRAWVHEGEREASSLILSAHVMKTLGYSVEAILSRSRERQEEWDLNELGACSSSSGVSQLCQISSQVAWSDRFDGVDTEMRTATPEMEETPQDGVRTALDARIAEAEQAGLSGATLEKLRALLDQYQDVFRLSFGKDPPVRVAPLKVRVRAGSTPVKCRSRRYPPEHMAFLERHVEELLKAGLVYMNNSSRYASPPRVVPKAAPRDYRMTVDTRAVNAITEPLLWPMPHLEVAITLVDGARVFFTLDWFRGYWQLPLHVESQELFTIMTHRGMVTPTRVLMGGSDSVGYCQSVVEKIFQPLLYHGLLAWLDDILGYAKTAEELMEILGQVLEACMKFGLKLHPNKCCFFQTSAKWCGKVISAEGVTHCPSRIEGLTSLPKPRSAADLQKFLCAANWMRQSIPKFSELVSPLMEVVDTAAKAIKSRKATKLAKVPISECGWSEQHDAVFAQVKQTLLDMVPLAHPDQDMAVCLFCDASQDFWGSVCTQLPEEELSKPLEEQNHRPLAFLSGRFVNAQSRWPTVEKEAYAIVESIKRLEYLLLRPKGFHLFTDHRNLVYIFDPYATDTGMQRYQADKLQRWAMTLTAYQYVIELINGEDNVWADILSRWSSSQQDQTQISRLSSLALISPVSPLASSDFQWPKLEEIVDLQRRAERVDGVQWSDERECFVIFNDKVWIPSTAVDLMERICVIAHAGASGHRGQRTTLESIKAWCWWESLQRDVEIFVKRCIHCLATKGTTEPRPFGAALHATKPNEVIHFDYLSMPADEVTGSKYVLVIKDDFSGFVELIACQSPDAETCVHGLLQWFARFGVATTWVSDQGSHFKNLVMEELARTLGVQHHFVTAYCPWANGTVEVVNRMLLHCLRALLSERRLSPARWESMLKVVQTALNHQPADRLNNRAPVTAFTCLPATTPLAAVFKSADRIETLKIAELSSRQQQHLQEVASALEAMHRDVTAVSDKRRRQARARRAAQAAMAHFSVGDYVLAAAVIEYPNKLAIKWQGPKRVVNCLSDWIFEVQDLHPPFNITTHHASRLRFYADSQREATEDLLQHALHTQGGHMVESFEGIRQNSVSKTWEVQVKWLGLDPLENTWEPYSALHTDVPVLLQRYTEAHRDEDDFKRMMTAHNRASTRRTGRGTSGSRSRRRA